MGATPNRSKGDPRWRAGGPGPYTGVALVLCCGTSIDFESSEEVLQPQPIANPSQECQERGSSRSSPQGGRPMLRFRRRVVPLALLFARMPLYRAPSWLGVLSTGIRAEMSPGNALVKLRALSGHFGAKFRSDGSKCGIQGPPTCSLRDGRSRDGNWCRWRRSSQRCHANAPAQGPFGAAARGRSCGDPRSIHARSSVVIVVVAVVVVVVVV